MTPKRFITCEPASRKSYLTGLMQDNFTWNLHFFDKCSIRSGEGGSIASCHCGSRMEKVDSQISVVSFHALRDVLDCWNVKRYRDPEHGQNYCLVLFICKKVIMCKNSNTIPTSLLSNAIAASLYVQAF